MNLWGKDSVELKEIALALGAPAYRGQQLFDYIYRRGIHLFEDMNQLPQNLRAQLSENYRIDIPILVRQQTSKDKKTAKILLRYHDDSLVESVLMSHDYGYSVCVSTQVGCAVGCTFCASGQNGLIRNLTAAEMLAQVYMFQWLYQIRIHSLVLMGSGEPLQNYDEVIRFIHLCANKNYLAMSYRNITLSTSGVIPGIYRLADENIPVTLALSLHAPNDELRRQIMPISRGYELQDLMKAIRYYFQKTGRRITCEYILLRDVNDSLKHAEELTRLLSKLPCHVNLIPMNENPGIPLYRPSVQKIQAFCQYLRQHRIAATVRKEMGKEIQAACGQLKMKFLAHNQQV